MLNKQQRQEAATIYFSAPAPDPVDWARTQVGFEPDPWQARVLWETRNLLLNCSRQSGKSSTTAHKALHTALYTDNALILLISPSLRQSSELFRKVSETIAKLPRPPKCEEDNKLSLQFSHNRSRIVSLPASEATVRGFSAVNLVIIDEASRVSDALYNALRPMLAISNGQLIVMSTPFGRRGFFFEEYDRLVASVRAGVAESLRRWVGVRITAAMCPRISAEFLAMERESLGEWWYRQEYEGYFCETLGQLFTQASIQAALDSTVAPLFAEGENPLESLILRPDEDLIGLLQATTKNGKIPHVNEMGA